jgi:predicted metal-dependent phosphoesterase TrpH
VAGLPDFLKAAEGSPVEAVPGIEFSTEYEGKELHILGLFIEPECYGAVNELLNEALQRKEESNLNLIRNLNRAGISLDYDRIKAEASGTVNRAVIAAAMVQCGYCESVKAAFRDWLAPERGYFVPPKRLDAFAVICFIKSIGAVAVLAHPFLNLEEGELEEFLKAAVPCGLDAVETLYPKFTPEQRERAREIAQANGLLISGGSDFHGENKPDIRLGTGRGDLQIPEKWLETLKIGI